MVQSRAAHGKSGYGKSGYAPIVLKKFGRPETQAGMAPDGE
jgi:hypothetical protein